MQRFNTGKLGKNMMKYLLSICEALIIAAVISTLALGSGKFSIKHGRTP